LVWGSASGTPAWSKIWEAIITERPEEVKSFGGRMEYWNGGIMEYWNDGNQPGVANEKARDRRRKMRGKTKNRITKTRNKENTKEGMMEYWKNGNRHGAGSKEQANRRPQ
jgi:hypothetical protein